MEQILKRRDFYLAQEEDEQVYSAKRAWMRHSLKESSIAWVYLPDRSRVDVLNLSIGGMGLEIDGPRIFEQIDNNRVTNVKFHIFNHAYEIKARFVHCEGKVCGFSFIEREGNCEAFFKDILGYIKIGSSLNKANSPASNQYSLKLEGIHGSRLESRVSRTGRIEWALYEYGTDIDKVKVEFDRGEIRVLHPNEDPIFRSRVLEQSFLITIGLLEKYSSPDFLLVSEGLQEELEFHIGNKSLLNK